MYTNNISIICHMRVCIDLRWLTMGCPSCMTYAAGAMHCISSIRFLVKSLKPALCLDYLVLSISITDSHTR